MTHRLQEIRFDRTLDVRGLSLPRPLLVTQQAIEALQSGEILKIVAGDQESANDFHTFARHAQLTLLGCSERKGQFQFFLRKS